jgi:hypothetical protein
MVAATIRFQIIALACAMVLVLPPEVGVRTAVAAAAVAQTGAAPKPAQQDPPQNFFSIRPAVLLNLDGDPIWSPIQGSDLKFVVNTNWDLFETPSKTLYLRNNDTWLSASDLKGPWLPAGKLPPSFAKLPADDNWKDVKAPQVRGARLRQVPSYVARRNASPAGRPGLSACARHVVALGEQHRQRSVPSREIWELLLSRGGPLVFGSDPERPVDVRHAPASGGLKEDFHDRPGGGKDAGIPQRRLTEPRRTRVGGSTVRDTARALRSRTSAG